MREVVRGHATSQARVLADVGGQEIFTVLASLGRRELPWEGEWAERPDVPPPAECPPRPLRPDHAGTIAERIEMRAANLRPPETLDGTPGTGRSALWVRNPWGSDAQAARSIVATSCHGNQPGRRRVLFEGNSLDNTLRIVPCTRPSGSSPTSAVHASPRATATGSCTSGPRTAHCTRTASQSAIVRNPRKASEQS